MNIIYTFTLGNFSWFHLQTLCKRGSYYEWEKKSQSYCSHEQRLEWAIFSALSSTFKQRTELTNMPQTCDPYDTYTLLISTFLCHPVL